MHMATQSKDAPTVVDVLTPVKELDAVADTEVAEHAVVAAAAKSGVHCQC